MLRKIGLMLVAAVALSGIGCSLGSASAGYAVRSKSCDGRDEIRRDMDDLQKRLAQMEGREAKCKH